MINEKKLLRSWKRPGPGLPRLRLPAPKSRNPEQLEVIMKRSSVIALAALLAGVWLAQPCPAQGPEAKPAAPKAARTAPLKIMITGKISKEGANYYIQGQKPAEVFTILNPDPKVLDKLAKSGKVVNIEATSVVGDNVNIQKIDGRPYQGPKENKSKGK